MASEYRQLGTPRFQPQQQIGGYNIQAPRDLGGEYALKGFEGLSQSLMAAGQKLNADEIKLSLEKGEAWRKQSQKTFREAVAAGEIHPTQNPHFAIGAMTVDGDMNARKMTNQWLSEWQMEIADPASTLGRTQGGFETFMQNKQAEHVEAEPFVSHYQSNSFYNTTHRVISGNAVKQNEDALERDLHLTSKAHVDNLLELAFQTDLGIPYAPSASQEDLQAAYDENYHSGAITPQLQEMLLVKAYVHALTQKDEDPTLLVERITGLMQNGATLGETDLGKEAALKYGDRLDIRTNNWRTGALNDLEVQGAAHIAIYDNWDKATAATMRKIEIAGLNGQDVHKVAKSAMATYDRLGGFLLMTYGRNSEEYNKYENVLRPDIATKLELALAKGQKGQVVVQNFVGGNALDSEAYNEALKRSGLSKEDFEMSTWDTWSAKGSEARDQAMAQILGHQRFGPHERWLQSEQEALNIALTSKSRPAADELPAELLERFGSYARIRKADAGAEGNIFSNKKSRIAYVFEAAYNKIGTGEHSYATGLAGAIADFDKPTFEAYARGGGGGGGGGADALAALGISVGGELTDDEWGAVSELLTEYVVGGWFDALNPDTTSREQLPRGVAEMLIHRGRVLGEGWSGPAEERLAKGLERALNDGSLFWGERFFSFKGGETPRSGIHNISDPDSRQEFGDTILAEDFANSNNRDWLNDIIAQGKEKNPNFNAQIFRDSFNKDPNIFLLALEKHDWYEKPGDLVGYVDPESLYILFLEDGSAQIKYRANENDDWDNFMPSSRAGSLSSHLTSEQIEGSAQAFLDWKLGVTELLTVPIAEPSMLAVMEEHVLGTSVTATLESMQRGGVQMGIDLMVKGDATAPERMPASHFYLHRGETDVEQGAFDRPHFEGHSRVDGVWQFRAEHPWYEPEIPDYETIRVGPYASQPESGKKILDLVEAGILVKEGEPYAGHGTEMLQTYIESDEYMAWHESFVYSPIVSTEWSEELHGPGYYLKDLPNEGRLGWGGDEDSKSATYRPESLREEHWETNTASSPYDFPQWARLANQGKDGPSADMRHLAGLINARKLGRIPTEKEWGPLVEMLNKQAWLGVPIPFDKKGDQMPPNWRPSHLDFGDPDHMGPGLRNPSVALQALYGWTEPEAKRFLGAWQAERRVASETYLAAEEADTFGHPPIETMPYTGESSVDIFNGNEKAAHLRLRGQKPGDDVVLEGRPEAVEKHTPAVEPTVEPAVEPTVEPAPEIPEFASWQEAINASRIQPSEPEEPFKVGGTTYKYDRLGMTLLKLDTDGVYKPETPQEKLLREARESSAKSAADTAQREASAQETLQRRIDLHNQAIDQGEPLEYTSFPGISGTERIEGFMDPKIQSLLTEPDGSRPYSDILFASDRHSDQNPRFMESDEDYHERLQYRHEALMKTRTQELDAIEASMAGSMDTLEGAAELVKEVSGGISESDAQLKETNPEAFMTRMSDRALRSLMFARQMSTSEHKELQQASDAHLDAAAEAFLELDETAQAAWMEAPFWGIEDPSGRGTVSDSLTPGGKGHVSDFQATFKKRVDKLKRERQAAIDTRTRERQDAIKPSAGLQKLRGMRGLQDLPSVAAIRDLPKFSTDPADGDHPGSYLKVFISLSADQLTGQTSESDDEYIAMLTDKIGAFATEGDVPKEVRVLARVYQAGYRDIAQVQKIRERLQGMDLGKPTSGLAVRVTAELKFLDEILDEDNPKLLNSHGPHVEVLSPEVIRKEEKKRKGSLSPDERKRMLLGLGK